MASIPKKFFRTTAHATPKYQLYQPGFNPSNSCWLDGGWITLPKPEWQKQKAAHQKLYAEALKHLAKQHHRDAGTPLKKMTPAQRQAWAYHAGNWTLYGKLRGVFAACSVNLAGNKASTKSVKWLRDKGYSFPRWIKAGPKGKPTNQLRGLKLPKDLIEENSAETAFDEVTATVDYNRGRSQEMFDAAVRGMDPTKAVDKPEGPHYNFTQFSAMIAFGNLMEQEELIMRGEWHLATGQEGIIPFEPEKERLLYAEMRAKLKVIDNFDEWYQASKKSHNECERHNLDNSKGHLFCFVLPEFYDDGTHAPWGDHDVPWANAKML